MGGKMTKTTTSLSSHCRKKLEQTFHDLHGCLLVLPDSVVEKAWIEAHEREGSGRKNEMAAVYEDAARMLFDWQGVPDAA